MPNCTFCGERIEKGTGKMFVFKTGKIAYYCSTKCEKNMLKLRRKARKLKWTKHYTKGK
ncbi:MAG: 50S ribosomal protein L24e [Candidatus Nanoarchaeia archaeon]